MKLKIHFFKMFWITSKKYSFGLFFFFLQYILFLLFIFELNFHSKKKTIEFSWWNNRTTSKRVQKEFFLFSDNFRFFFLFLKKAIVNIDRHRSGKLFTQYFSDLLQWKKIHKKCSGLFFLFVFTTNFILSFFISFFC